MATQNLNKIESEEDRELVFTRVFDAPREMVWDAWTDPEKIARWWGPNGFSITTHKMEVKEGGVWRLVMHGPDGRDYENKIIYDEIVKPERIVFHHTSDGEDGLEKVGHTTTATFEEQGSQTKVTMRLLFPTIATRAWVIKEYKADEGGRQTMGRLAEYLASAPVVVERTFNTPAALVWKAITDRDQMKLWYFSTLEDFRPEVGFETLVNVHHEGKDYPHLWKVTDVVPGEKLTYSWKYKNHPGESFVTFELFAEGKKTRVVLTHQGTETFLPEQHPAYARSNFIAGWTHIIGTGLKEFAEQTASADKVFTTSRTFDAPVDIVWKAWTDAGQLAKWWGPQGFTNPVCEIDVRDGGAMRIHMRGPDGNVYPMTGSFKEITPPSRLSFLSSALDKADKPLFEVLTIVSFTSHGNKTRLLLYAMVSGAKPEAAPHLAGMDTGWNQSLDRLADLVSTRK